MHVVYRDDETPSVAPYEQYLGDFRGHPVTLYRRWLLITATYQITSRFLSALGDPETRLGTQEA